MVQKRKSARERSIPTKFSRQYRRRRSGYVYCEWTGEKFIGIIEAISTLHTADIETMRQHLRKFLDQQLSPGEKIDLLLSGENGDNRDAAFYTSCESFFNEGTSVARFKHMCGEFATASAIGCWLAIQALKTQSVPSHMIKKASFNTTVPAHTSLQYA